MQHLDITKKKRLKCFGHVASEDNTSYASHSYKNDFINRNPEESKWWRDRKTKDRKLPQLTVGRLAKDEIGALCG